jgi:hypothetical protein
LKVVVIRGFKVFWLWKLFVVVMEDCGGYRWWRWMIRKFVMVVEGGGRS